MSSSCDVYLIRKNNQTQTDINILETPDLFNTNNDNRDIQMQIPPNSKFGKEEVERLVSAVQGDDETIRRKCRLINERTKRFRSLIQSLKNQIESQKQGLDEEEFKELKNRFIRELAYSIDPASRHSKRKNLFGHQKYDHPIVVGKAAYKSKYSGNDDYLRMIFNSSEFEAIYNFNGDLYLSDDNMIFYINQIPGQALSINKSISLTSEGVGIGNITLSNSNQRPSVLPMGPVSDDDKMSCIVKALGFENEINLKSLISTYDFSFIDIILSLPRLTQSQAESLLVYLYRYNFLSAFVRSKICQFILNIKSECAYKPWPELLGRFISILSPQWYQKSSDIIDTLDNKRIINVITMLKELNPVSKFLFCIIIDEFRGMDRGDDVDFVWSLLYLSIFMNKYLGGDKDSQEARQQLNTFVLLLKAKPQGSNTRTNTTKIIDIITKSNNYKVPTTRFNPSGFLQDLFTTHGGDIITILRAIPRTKEEASPLFFPLVLEVMEALERFDEIIEQFDSLPDETGIISNVETDFSITQSESSRRRNRTSHSGRPIYTNPATPSSTRSRRSNSRNISRSQNSNRLTENSEDSQDFERPLSASYSRSSRSRHSTRNNSSIEPRNTSSGSRNHSGSRLRNSRRPVQIQQSGYEYEEEESFYD